MSRSIPRGWDLHELIGNVRTFGGGHSAFWMRLIFLFIGCAMFFPARAQLLDSIGIFTQEPPRFVAKLDMRGSFVRNQNVRLMGVKLGLEHARRFQYGIGYTFLFTPVVGEDFVEGVGTTEQRLRLGYITPYVDYAFYQRGPWEVRIPVQLGFGAGSTSYTDAEGARRTVKRTGLLIYEPAMTVQYRILNYFALSGGWGFRLVIQTGDKLGENLNAPIYTLGIRIFFGDLWRDLRGMDD